jgi:hypothetical protein
MAPRKKTEKEEKPEKATGAEGSDMILQYLRGLPRLASSCLSSAHPSSPDRPRVVRRQATDAGLMLFRSDE